MGIEVEVTPDFWTPDGETELRARGRSLKIWSGIPGERARVRILHEGTHQDQGSWRGSPSPHPMRVEPPCDRYHMCGGCPMMHLTVEGQRRARRWLVTDAFAQVGLEDVDIGEITPSPDGDVDFRHLVKLGVGWSEQGRLRVGAWGRRTKTVVPIPECTVATSKLRWVMGTIAHHVLKLDIWPYDPANDKGTIRAIILRQSRSTGEVLVTLVAGRKSRQLDQLAEAIVEHAREVIGVALHLNDEPGNAIFGRDEDGNTLFTTLQGRAWLEDTLNGITYRVGPGDFFQTNPGMAEVIYQQTLDALALEGGEPVLDLYCGVGGYALPAAKRTGWALGVEEVTGAVEAAKEAARRNGVPAEFMAGKVGEVLETLRPRLAAVRPVITVNPARRGLEDGVVEGILGLRPRRIAYISCNPRALARDLVAFRAAGFHIGPVSLYDMFPNTSHVEAMVVLKAPDAEGLVRRAPRRVRAEKTP